MSKPYRLIALLLLLGPSCMCGGSARHISGGDGGEEPVRDGGSGDGGAKPALDGGSMDGGAEPTPDGGSVDGGAEPALDGGSMDGGMSCNQPWEGDLQWGTNFADEALGLRVGRDGALFLVGYEQGILRTTNIEPAG